jgi:hypothetical protein
MFFGWITIAYTVNRHDNHFERFTRRFTRAKNFSKTPDHRNLTVFHGAVARALPESVIVI